MQQVDGTQSRSEHFTTLYTQQQKQTQYAEKMQQILEYHLPVNASHNTRLPSSLQCG